MQLSDAAKQRALGRQFADLEAAAAPHTGITAYNFKLIELQSRLKGCKKREYVSSQTNTLSDLLGQTFSSFEIVMRSILEALKLVRIRFQPLPGVWPFGGIVRLIVYLTIPRGVP
jgi:hypothetical protein